jgi:formate hydrogenlyase subunit 3/multisubunit Na+/H+ antiporter MnhD subunit
MNICPKCGGKILNGAKFCTKCGYHINEKIETEKIDQNARQRHNYRLADFENENIPGASSALLGFCLCIAAPFLGGIAPVSFIVAIFCIITANVKGFHSCWLKAAMIIGLLGAIKGFFDFIAYFNPYS